MTGKKAQSATLLDVDESLFNRRLLLEPGDAPQDTPELQQLLPDTAHLTAVTITPKPGVCIKARCTVAGQTSKVFINICTSESIPVPEELTDQELIEILESDESSDFRVPMSIGAPHDELDKSGGPCKAYDVVINPSFLEKTKVNTLFQNFFVLATMEALDVKYQIELEKNEWVILKNKLYYGTAPDQTIRTSMPLVQELSGRRPIKPDDDKSTDPSTARRSKQLIRPHKADGDKGSEETAEAQSDALELPDKSTNQKRHERLITPVTSTKTTDEGSKKKPKCVLRRVMDNSSTMIAVKAEVELPGLRTGADVAVFAGEDRLVLDSDAFFLDLFLPCTAAPGAATAHFVTARQTMIITVPVLVG